jgi:hypothetical protein
MVLEEERSAVPDVLHIQVERILHSEEFRSSEVLRRLLSFLTVKTLLGEADQLKEYSVAIDGLGKPTSYDPQHNSAVRIQMGRLRQRLAEYYRTEGKNDPILVELPKGRFRLTFEHRAMAAAEPVATTPPPPPVPVSLPVEAMPARRSNRLWILCLAGLAFLAAGYLLGFNIAKRQGYARERWTPAMQELWSPFLTSSRPLIVTIEDPLFAEVRSNPGVYLRDRSMNQWSDVLASAALKGLKGALTQSEVRPSRYYTAFGEAEASFLLGGLLQPKERTLSLVRTSQLSWQQLADNNVVFVGVQNLFFDQLRGMPIAPQLVPDLAGVRDQHPSKGQPGEYLDQYVTAPSEQGTAYALVTHLPGPNGQNDIESFTSNRSAGYLAAVQWFTDPQFAANLQRRMVESNRGVMPRYYQILLKVSYRDGVPTGTEFVLERELDQRH